MCAILQSEARFRGGAGELPSDFIALRGDTTAVIIGTSARSDPARGITARSRRDGKADGNLSGVLVDCGLVHGWCTGRMGIHVGPGAYIATTDSRRVTRALVMEEIDKALRSRRYHKVLLYYSGHGQQGTGAWCFEEGTTITPHDIISLWQAAKLEGKRRVPIWGRKYFKSSVKCKAGRVRNYVKGYSFEDVHFRKDLFIITDSCYAGKWVDAVKKFSESLGSEAVPGVIAVQASSQSHEPSEDTPQGGSFTKQFLRCDSSRVEHGVSDSALGYGFGLRLLTTPVALFKGATVNQFKTASSPCAYIPPVDTHPAELAFYSSWTEMDMNGGTAFW